MTKNKNLKQLIIVCRDFDINWNQFLNPIYVGVESGAVALIKNNLPIQFISGDFDSINKKQWELINYQQKKANFKVFKVDQKKDYLDSELAIATALKLKVPFQQVVIISSGQRWDMILAQINFLRKYQKYQPILIDEDNYLFTLKAKSKFIVPEHLLNYRYISFFCLNDQSVTYNFTGCKYYNASDIIINNQDVLAISNEFDLTVTKNPTIEIKSGDCIVALSQRIST
ncbi:MAG: thiamine diphosphokinase [Spiroplasma sp.]|nr:thiamine diphosphokinase [Spiroplasma sp.]